MTDTTYPTRSAADGNLAVDLETPSVELDRKADEWLSDAERPSLRRQVKQDAAAARAWSTQRAARARTAVVEHPVEATVWALGVGLVIGLLLRR